MVGEGPFRKPPTIMQATILLLLNLFHHLLRSLFMISSAFYTGSDYRRYSFPIGFQFTFTNRVSGRGSGLYFISIGFYLHFILYLSIYSISYYIGYPSIAIFDSCISFWLLLLGLSISYYILPTPSLSVSLWRYL